MRWYGWQKWSKYPKLYGLHKAIMDYFIYKNPNYCLRVAYDVPVGSPRPPLVDANKAVLAGWQYATSHRIDAVFARSNGFEVVEIKPESELSAVGQVLMYYDLFTATYKDMRPVQARLITLNAHPEIERLCDSYGIVLTNYKFEEILPDWKDIIE